MGVVAEKSYSIKNTTKVLREKIANDALAISTLDAAMPTEETMEIGRAHV